MAANFKDNLAAYFQGLARQSREAVASVGQGARRRDQILAACMVPFVIVLLAGFAVSVKSITDGILPTTGNLSFIGFFVGTALVCATMAGCFAWVKTGGFGIFAH